jgi:hypothetical protein
MITKVKYIGAATLAADSATYPIFNTVTSQMGGNMLASANVHRVIVDIDTENADGAYTLNAYKSPDRGTTWVQISTEAISAPADTATVVRDFIVEGLADFKIDIVNNGTAKSPMYIDIALTDQGATL